MRRALARVDLAAVERNCGHLARLASPAALCAVVKADGYGHGAVPVARAARRGGAQWLAVATADEAAELRAGGVAGPLLVMGVVCEDDLPVAVAAGADVVAWRPDAIPAIAERAGREPIGVHVKLDTGMGRLGTRDPDEGARTVEAVDATPGVRLAGLMTHFATADEPDTGFLRAQLGAFTGWVERVGGRSRTGVLVHAANSAAAIAAPDARLDMVRCGVAVYGLSPFQGDPRADGLEPALSLESYVAEVKRCDPGQSTGYGRRWVARRASWIGTLPIGYGDGVRRAHTNNLDVLVGGRRVPVVGAVSMDNITVDLGEGEEPPVQRGAPAVLIGAQGAERILSEELAARLGTINYEITSALTARVAREHHDGGALAATGPPAAALPDRP